MSEIAQIEPLLTTRALSGPFDYRLNDDLGQVEVGSLLEVPFGKQRLLGLVTGKAATSKVPANRLVEPIRNLDRDISPKLVELALAVAKEYCSTPARALSLVLPPGVSAAKRSEGIGHKEQLYVELTEAGRLAVTNGGSATPKQITALKELLEGPLLASELAARSGVDQGMARRLEAKGFVAIAAGKVERRPEEIAVGAEDSRPQLNPDQIAALKRISAAIIEQASEPFLINGVTGSGKTEVYLRAAEETLAQGRTVIVLVPEIGLTPQTVSRFTRRFGDRVAVLHSKLSAGERFDEWQRLREGAATICVGPRSALFAPLQNVGLIVIDEEHDSSYKQESDPRYDSHRVAQLRAEIEGSVLICGSATPRPESWASMERIDLPQRADGQRLPPVEVVDMRGSRAFLHPSTREALEGVKGRGEKAIILLNRRGWSAFVSCRSCGYVPECPNCDVTLTLHMGRGLLCHHCGHREEVPKICPSCSSATVARHGIGTEQLEAELNAVLSPMPIFRLDADTASAKGAIAKVLSAFDQAESGVLMGTQMVAKGHDFPDVTLGVMLDADSTLRIPDFRSEERTFALIAQLAGRSGRGPKGGEVIVQTLAPEEPSIRFAAAHDTVGFMATEMERRRALTYPPYSSLARIVCGGPDEELVRAAAESVVAKLDGLEITVLGPAPLFRVKGMYRYQALIKGQSRETVYTAVGAAVKDVAANHKFKGVKFAPDIDP